MKSLHSLRRGSLAAPLIAVVALLALIGIVLATMARRPVTTANEAQPLTIFCAASNKSVFEAIRRDYEQAYGMPLQVQYGPSQTLAGRRSRSSSTGDLYLAGRR